MKRPAPLPVLEVDHRSRLARERDDTLRSLRQPPGNTEAIERAVATLDENTRAWQRGFFAGIAVANLARGTRDFEPIDPDEEPTAPYPIINPNDLKEDSR